LNNSAQPSAADLSAFESLKKLSPPKANSHARAFAWYSLVNRFSDDTRKIWAAGES
jgi:hypothetical protein